MQSIQEYAKQAGVSPRAARLLAAQGRIPARKIGGRWMVERTHRLHSRGPGRRISSRAFDHLAAYLDGDGDSLSPDQRRRARERAGRIAETGIAQVRRYAERPDSSVEHFLASKEDFDELRARSDLTWTGISHPDAEVYGRVLDAYVSSEMREEIVLFYMLEPAAPGAANVVLRVQDPPPVVRRLHVIADLLEDPSPRSRAEASRLLDIVLNEAG